MKRLLTIFIIIIISLFTLSACDFYDRIYGEIYDEGYYDGIGEGYGAGYDIGYEAGFNAALGGQEETIDEAPATEPPTTNYNNNPIIENWSIRQPKAPPVSGTLLSGQQYYGSEITVTADSSSNCVVVLKSAGGVERMSFFVRAGETATVGVPSEYLYVYFASGTVWYGYGEGLMFGDDTMYSKDDDLIDFAGYSCEYTLYPVTNGNFSQTPCDAADFFR